MSFDAKSFFNRLMLAFVLFTLTAAAFEGFFVKWGFHENDFDALLDGTLLRPWVYRRLVPEAANAFRASLSIEQQDELISTLEADNFLSEKFRQTDIQPRYIIEYYFIYFISFAAFFASAYVWRRLATEVTSDPIAGTLAPMLFVLIFPLLLTSGGYFYDFTELFFFSTASLLALRGNWLGLLLLTPFAELNKESYFFLLFSLYPLFRLKFSLRETALRLGISILTAGLIYLYIHELYANNFGWTTIFFLDTNIKMYTPLILLLLAWIICRRPFDPKIKVLSVSITVLVFATMTAVPVYFVLEHTYSVFSGERLFLPHLIMIVWLVEANWSRLSEAWKRHALIAAAINFPLWILFCYPGELRNLSMLYPTFILILSFHINGVIRKCYARS